MFPHTVELARQHGAGRFSVGTGPAIRQGRAAGAGVLEGVSDRGNLAEDVRVNDDRTFIDDFEIENGTLPYLLIYGRDGQIVRTFVQGDPQKAGFEEADVEAAVKRALTAGE